MSRGVLSRSLAPDGRTGRFDAAEVDRLARRGRPVVADAGDAGHPVHRGVDPRPRHLLDRLDDLLPRAERAVIDDVLAAASSLSDQPASVDFALGALASGLRMPLGATEAIFAIARVAGWIAHALEEYGEDPLRFRARAIYEGAPPR